MVNPPHFLVLLLPNLLHLAHFLNDTWLRLLLSVWQCSNNKHLSTRPTVSTLNMMNTLKNRFHPVLRV